MKLLVAQSCPTLVTPSTVVHQDPLSMEFPMQEYWSGLPFPSPGYFPTQGSNQGLLHFRKILKSTGKHLMCLLYKQNMQLPQ